MLKGEIFFDDLRIFQNVFHFILMLDGSLLYDIAPFC